MSEIIDFIKENANYIIIIVVVVLFLLVIINIKGIDLNEPKPKSKLVQEVTVETFNNPDENIDTIAATQSDNFCHSYLGNSEDLEKACNSLTENNCASVSCCVYNNSNKKCVSGDINGPTYKTDTDGKLVTMDTYYYLGKANK